jgi:hypothetical protein
MANDAAFLAAHPGYMHTYYLSHEGKRHARIVSGAERQSKLCRKCGIEKNRKEFTIRRSGSRVGHLSTYCKGCSIVGNRNAKKRDPSIYRRIEWPSKLKRLYGLSVNGYNDLMGKQNGGCALCGITEPSLGNRQYSKNTRSVFDVDHNHKTGKVRGLLCTRCNRLVGLANDNPETARKLVAYLS